MTKFERYALAFLGASVTALVAVAIVMPVGTTTAVPTASFEFAASATIPPRPADAAEAAATLPSPPAEADAPGDSVQTVAAAFAEAGYDLESVIAGADAVPRVLINAMPVDLEDVREVKRRKAIFFQAVLPLVLQVNEEIVEERKRLWDIRVAKAQGRRVDALDRLWLAVVSEKYRVARGDLDALARRIDVIPPSLALAQAAAESGWGTSRFVREGNAMFGQWTFSRALGLEPRRRDEGERHLVRAFDSLLDSVRAYALNLNTHRAYRRFRAKRAELRVAGGPLRGDELAALLTAYSEQGGDYVDTLQSIMAVNELERLDGARLRDDDDTGLRFAGEEPSAVPPEGDQPPVRADDKTI